MQVRELEEARTSLTHQVGVAQTQLEAQKAEVERLRAELGEARREHQAVLAKQSAAAEAGLLAKDQAMTHARKAAETAAAAQQQLWAQNLERLQAQLHSAAEESKQKALVELRAELTAEAERRESEIHTAHERERTAAARELELAHRQKLASDLPCNVRREGGKSLVIGG